MRITIIPPSGSGKYPLLFRCRASEPPLPAYMEFNSENGLVTFGYSYRDSEPSYVILWRRFWWSIDAGTTRRQAVNVAKELIPQLSRVGAGYSVGWNGNDHAGVLDEDALIARREIRKRLWWTFGPEHMARMSASIKR